MTATKQKLSTKYPITWCPGCPNNLILESVKTTLSKLIDSGKYKHQDFAMVTGIGCHAKIFDYLNLSGIYGLHGRVLPTCLGLKIGNPDLSVIGFAGDGDAYAEGIAHFIHAGRYNADFTYVVHDNQSFSLTTGQATPTSQQGYKNKSQIFGVVDMPLNSIKLALATGVNFIARAFAYDTKHTAEMLERAIKHRGFSFVEIIQPCLIFNLDMNNLNKLFYKIPVNKDKAKAEKLAEEWNYNTKEGKIPIGVIYEAPSSTLKEKYFRKSASLKK
ncbi:MAG TPA: 2-oxoacid:ferredoxin oxidoreductase subunit beta [Candidatus Pacearchaeota archaeon]|nr:2-oxoglutarate oxidoreductase subunit KorB [archaeon BMS3Abin17]HDK42137.1 2-oxoacid:ferredoxin oxidoreductase subunit beta [Candidatus Pacearchaeota archaeon]HDZ61318.1 2-oxoacid:ferredoxin oxidoreductase subunit beta [Candidatus Pacearchaeota archaeon]